MLGRRSIAFSVAALLLAGAAIADDGPGGDELRRAPQVLDAAEHGVGRLVPDLAFTDLSGKPGRLSDYADRRALVLAFTSVGCPICKKYAPRLARLPAAYDAKDVAVLLVNASPQDTPEAMRAAVASYGFTSRYVVDHDRMIARALAATTTAEVFVLDRARTLVYRGALDDQYGVGWTREAPAAEYAKDAVAGILAGALPRVQATTAPGCVLDIAPMKPSSDAAITWHADVSRIVQRRCERCHRQGEAGPFTLTSYNDVKGNAGMVRWAVVSRRMPPWFAGAESLGMANDPSLTDSERDQVLAWIDAGCPEGDPHTAPVPRAWTPGWGASEPDALIQVPTAYEVPAEGVIDYQYVDVPTSFGEDKWVRGFEIRPSAPEVVHHILVFVIYPRSHPRFHEQPRVKGGLEGYFAVLVPGQGALRMPAGTAKFLPAGATLRFQIHYTPNGTPVKDRPALGLYFADGAPAHEMRSTGIYDVKFKIPPRAPNHAVTKSRVIPLPARIHGFLPHMHLRGKAFRYEAIYPDGETEVLLDVPKYDFNWQLFYELAEPLDVPAGTRIRVTGWYDNSADNPANPDPDKTVRHGEQTFDEMMIGYVDWHPRSER